MNSEFGEFSQPQTDTDENQTVPQQQQQPMTNSSGNNKQGKMHWLCNFFLFDEITD